jgi:hypothetical protein
LWIQIGNQKPESRPPEWWVDRDPPLSPTLLLLSNLGSVGADGAQSAARAGIAEARRDLGASVAPDEKGQRACALSLASDEAAVG